ncbi:uncharacterized protein [Montipora foliosa]|uniref:uncharacterized protein n=1 Tax=Montipora foliosa TaxID=591990 RepID=UPI0035F20254
MYILPSILFLHIEKVKSFLVVEDLALISIRFESSLVVQDLALISIHFDGFSIPAQKVLKRNIARFDKFSRESLYYVVSTFSTTMADKNSLLELEVTGVVNEQSREVEIVKTACRKRKPNFSAQEIAIITQKFEENQAVLKSKFTNTNTNKMKQSVWEEMTIAVNAVGTAHRSVSEVKEKWTNLQRTAKNELSKFRLVKRRLCLLLKTIDCHVTREENLYIEMISNPNEAADLPISPIVTITEADMSAAMGDEGVQLSGMGTEDEISPKGPPVAAAGPNSTTCRCACKQKKVTSSDVLRLQYETLQCKKETLLLKKAKLELEIKLLDKQKFGLSTQLIM